MSNYLIEKGVPKSARKRADSFPFKQMQPGDSFIIPSGNSVENHNQRTRAYQAAYRLGLKISIKTSADGIRIWLEGKRT